MPESIQISPPWVDHLPRRPVATSDGLGWQSVQAHRFDALKCSELDLPPAPGHFIAAHLMRPCHVDTRWSGRPHRGRSLPGNAMLMTAGQDSVWHCSSAIDELHVFLDPAVVDEVAEELGRPNFSLIDGVGIVDPVLNEIAHQLLAEIERPGIGTRLFADTIARSLALQLLRRHSTVGASGVAQRVAMTARQLRLAVDYIESHLGEDLSLERIAQAPGMSAFRFARAFRAATGQSPRQYVIARRIECAKQLLRTGTAGVADVAQRVGFATQSHFTSVFRRRCGTTPKRYRDLSRI